MRIDPPDLGYHFSMDDGIYGVDPVSSTPSEGRIRRSRWGWTSDAIPKCNVTSVAHTGARSMNDDGKPAWDDDLARQFIGKHIIIGITYLTVDGELEKQQQMHGHIVIAEGKKGFGIRLAESREMCWLPPDLGAIKPAKPGEYRFRSTGEVVVNPDLMAAWTLKEERSH
jgi:hypothetical protein